MNHGGQFRALGIHRSRVWQKQTEQSIASKLQYVSSRLGYRFDHPFQVTDWRKRVSESGARTHRPWHSWNGVRIEEHRELLGPQRTLRRQALTQMGKARNIGKQYDRCEVLAADVNN